MVCVTVLFHFACKLSTHTHTVLQVDRHFCRHCNLGLVLLLHVASFCLESTSDAILFT